MYHSTSLLLYRCIVIDISFDCFPWFPDEISPYLRSGFQLRETIQYRWENLNRDTGRPYHDFEEYLSLFKSKRRMQIKRERRAVYEEQGIQIKTIRGDDPLVHGTLPYIFIFSV